MNTARQNSDDLYVRWNLALLDAFFSPASAKEEVWLQASAESLDAIGPHLGGGLGLVKALRRGAPWLSDLDKSLERFADAAILLSRQRATPYLRPTGYIDPGTLSGVYTGQNAPTYLPYLAALTRTAAGNEDSFYRTLQEDFGLPDWWGTNQLRLVRTVWDDLQCWTDQHRGQFGYFRVRALGGYEHIGLAKSQVVMASKDVRLVSGVFAQVGLRPGQALEERNLREVRQAASNTNYPLSAAFRRALGDRDYTDLIDARLRGLFEDWDGSVPERARRGRVGDEAPNVAERVEVELCLSYGDADPSRWNIHWQFPARDDARQVKVEAADHKWVTRQLDGAVAITCDDLDSTSQSAARECLKRSASRDVEFTARTEGSDNNSAVTLVLCTAPLRVLAFRRNDALSRDEFREHPLRPYGAVALLAAPANAKNLLDYLEREALAFEPLSSDGLPDGWLLVLLLDCSKLNEEKLKTLPDGRDNRTAPRMIRLVGGRSVNRGGGRQYLSYDLPTLELDAPADTQLDAEGLILTPENEQTGSPPRAASSAPGQAELANVTAPRRLQIELDATTPLRTFTITAQTGQQAQTLRLRVASDSGEHVAYSRDFSLDPTGAPAADGHGMRGIKTDNALPNPDLFAVRERDIGVQLSAADAALLTQGAAIEFLDSLAQSTTGSMAYGTARDQLGRLLDRDGGRATPVEVLLTLRSRGHLEVETNARGHLTRIHAIKPAIYGLSVTVEGLKTFGVMGTLRISHWRALAEVADRHFVYLEPRYAWEAPCLRLVLGNMDEVRRIASGMGFLAHEQPSSGVASWSAGYLELAADVERDAMLAWGTHTHAVDRLNPNTLRYFLDRNGVSVADGLARQLMKMDDPATGQHKIYVLGMRNPEQPPRYGFVRDSRWGTWLAIGAFADLAAGLGIVDGCPWPVPYAEDGSVWIPARAGLPVILERALVLCSGEAPRVVDVTGADPDCDEGWVLRHGDSRLPSPRISRVYEGMATGMWLVYRWVPREVAQIVALKLRAALRPT